MPLDQLDNLERATADRQREDEPRMSFGDHLEDLRYRVLMALGGIVAATVLTLVFGRELVGWIVRPLAYVLASAGLPPQTYNFSPMGGFAVYLKVSLVAGLVVASPWVIWQLWCFVSGGLYRHERRAVYAVAPFSATMSLLAVAFMYYLMLPISLAFLIFFSTAYPPPQVDVVEPGGLMARLTGLAARMGGGAAGNRPGFPNPTDAAAQPDDATLPDAARLPILTTDPADPLPGQMWMKLPEGELRVHHDGGVHRYAPLAGQSMLTPMMEINQYIGFVVMLTLGIVLAFQLPVVMLVLGSTGVMDPTWLARYRRHCVLGCFGLAAVFTPAEPISMVVLAVPMWLLFELGLWLMRRTYRTHDIDTSQPDD
ncbi:MAG: twin-arginine translocase subunit TatC [Phycisphaeraceae bacterium]